MCQQNRIKKNQECNIKFIKRPCIPENFIDKFMELNWRNRYQIFLSKKKTMESLPCLLLAIDGTPNYLNLKQNNLMELTC